MESHSYLLRRLLRGSQGIESEAEEPHPLSPSALGRLAASRAPVKGKQAGVADGDCRDCFPLFPRITQYVHGESLEVERALGFE